MQDNYCASQCPSGHTYLEHNVQVIMLFDIILFETGVSYVRGLPRPS